MITALIVFAAVFLFILGAWGVAVLLRREDQRDPFAQAALTVTPTDGFADLGPMPGEIAHDEFLAAPLPTLPPGTTQHADPTLTIDPVRYGYNLRYRYSDELAGDIGTTNVLGPEVGTADTRDGDPVAVAEDRPAAAVTEAGPPPSVTRVHLPPITGPAMAVLAALTAPVRAQLERAEQAEADAFQAEALAVFPEWKPWAGDDTLTSMRAIRVDGGMDAPLSAPPEWHIELEDAP